MIKNINIILPLLNFVKKMNELRESSYYKNFLIKNKQFKWEFNKIFGSKVHFPESNREFFDNFFLKLHFLISEKTKISISYICEEILSNEELCEFTEQRTNLSDAYQKYFEDFRNSKLPMKIKINDLPEISSMAQIIDILYNGWLVNVENYQIFNQYSSYFFNTFFSFRENVRKMLLMNIDNYAQVTYHFLHYCEQNINEIILKHLDQIEMGYENEFNQKNWKKALKHSETSFTIGYYLENKKIMTNSLELKKRIYLETKSDKLKSVDSSIKEIKLSKIPLDFSDLYDDFYIQYFKASNTFNDIFDKFDNKLPNINELIILDAEHTINLKFFPKILSIDLGDFDFNSKILTYTNILPAKDSLFLRISHSHKITPDKPYFTKIYSPIHPFLVFLTNDAEWAFLEWKKHEIEQILLKRQENQQILMQFRKLIDYLTQMSQRKNITKSKRNEIQNIFTQKKLSISLNNTFGNPPHESPLEQKTFELEIYNFHFRSIFKELIELIVFPKFKSLEFIKNYTKSIKEKSIDPYIENDFYGAPYISFLLCSVIYTQLTQDNSIFEKKLNFGMNFDDIEIFSKLAKEKFTIENFKSFLILIQKYLLNNWFEIKTLTEFCQKLLQTINPKKERIFPNFSNFNEIAEIITAFANNNGGIIYIGVNHENSGISDEEIEEFTNKFATGLPKFSAKFIYEIKSRSFKSKRKILILEVKPFLGIISYEKIAYNFTKTHDIYIMDPEEISKQYSVRKRDIFESLIESIKIQNQDMRNSIIKQLHNHIGLIRNLEPNNFSKFLRILAYYCNFLYLDFDDGKYMQKPANKFYEKHKNDTKLRMEVDWFKPTLRSYLYGDFGDEIVPEGENARGNTDLVIVNISSELKVLYDSNKKIDNRKDNNKINYKNIPKRGIEILDDWVNQGMVQLGKTRCGFLVGYDFRKTKIPDKYLTDSPVERVKFKNLNGKLLCKILFLGNMKRPSDLK